jgi:hypothetical protein
VRKSLKLPQHSQFGESLLEYLGWLLFDVVWDWDCGVLVPSLFFLIANEASVRPRWDLWCSTGLYHPSPFQVDARVYKVKDCVKCFVFKTSVPNFLFNCVIVLVI